MFSIEKDQKLSDIIYNIGGVLTTENSFTKNGRKYSIYILNEMFLNSELIEQANRIYDLVYEDYLLAFPNEDERTDKEEYYELLTEDYTDDGNRTEIIFPVVMDETDPENHKVVSYSISELYHNNTNKPLTALFAYVVRNANYGKNIVQKTEHLKQTDTYIPSEIVRYITIKILEGKKPGVITWECDKHGTNTELTSMPADKRLKVVHNFGARILNIDWVQPPLDSGLNPLPLELFAYPKANGLFFASQQTEDINNLAGNELENIVNEIKQFIHDYYVRVAGSELPEKDYVQKMHAQLNDILNGKRNLIKPLEDALK